MFEYINSKYILKEIFSYLREKLFLKIIAYNKRLQERCSIDIMNYKKNASIYIKKDEEGNSLIKSAKNNLTLYNGGYSNKQKNGLGIDYNYKDIKLTEFVKMDKKYFKDLNINISEEVKKSKNFENFTFTEEKKMVL